MSFIVLIPTLIFMSLDPVTMPEKGKWSFGGVWLRPCDALISDPFAELANDHYRMGILPIRERLCGQQMSRSDCKQRRCTSTILWRRDGHPHARCIDRRSKVSGIEYTPRTWGRVFKRIFSWNASRGLTYLEWCDGRSEDVLLIHQTGWTLNGQWTTDSWYCIHTHMQLLPHSCSWSATPWFVLHF